MKLTPDTFLFRVAGLARERALLALCLALCPFSARATNHILRMDEVMAGMDGDRTIQFIEITVGGGDQKSWGPQPGETTSRAMLVFFNAAGVETGRFLFPFNAPQG